MRKMINNTPSKKTYTEQLCRSISKPKHVLIEASTGESIPISQKAWYSLAKRAGKNNTLLSIIEQVYCRGILTADEASYNSPEHQSFCRVDSFLHEGKAYELDYDLVTEQCTVPDGRKHMHIIKNAIKTHKKINQKEVIKESNVGFGRSLAMIGRSANKGLFGGSKRRSAPSSRSSSPRVAKPEVSFDDKAELAIQKKQEKDRLKWVANHPDEYHAAKAKREAAEYEANKSWPRKMLDKWSAKSDQKNAEYNDPQKHPIASRILNIVRDKNETPKPQNTSTINTSVGAGTAHDQRKKQGREDAMKREAAAREAARNAHGHKLIQK